MSNLYIVRELYKPNKAETNRLLGYLHSLDDLGVNATMVFFVPDRQASEMTDVFRNIDIVYYWKKWNIKNRYLKMILEHFYVRMFINSLKPGDRVFLSGFEIFIKNFIRKKGIKVFFEAVEKPGLARPFGWFSDIENRIYFKKAKYLDGVSVISTAIKDDMIRMGVPANKVHIINMTVDAERFKALKKQKREKYIAYCGTAHNNKDGVDQLIKAFAIFSSIQKDYKLYIIGETPSLNMANSNKILAENLGVGDKVVFTGIVPANDIPQMLKNAVMLALDRPDNEQAKYGFPTKLGEYLLTENPVVVTSVGDIPLFLTDGENALLSKPDNPEEFASKMCWVAEHPKESEEIGKKGAMVAMNHFNSKIETEKLLKMIMQ